MFPPKSLDPTSPGLSLTIVPGKVAPSSSAQQPAPTQDHAGDGGEAAAVAVVERDEIDNDLADSLVKQLEARSDSEEESEEEEGRGGGGATNQKVVWSALPFAAHLAGMHQEGKEKLRVKSYLSSELARAEKEARSSNNNGRRGPPRKRPTLDVRTFAR